MTLIVNKQEEEILKLKDNPDALHKKIEDLLSKEKVNPGSKKLPPLQALHKMTTPNKQNLKKDLSKVKAPILQNNVGSDGVFTGRHNPDRNINDTESEIDIKESNSWKKDDKVPSYNPKLLNQKNKAGDNLISLQSNDFDGNEHPFVKPNNEHTNIDDEFNNLMADLDDDKPYAKNKLRDLGYDQRTDFSKNVSKVKPQERIISHDSFEDLMDEFGDEPPKNSGPPGMAKVHIVKTNKNTYDEFEF